MKAKSPRDDFSYKVFKEERPVIEYENITRQVKEMVDMGECVCDYVSDDSCPIHGWDTDFEDDVIDEYNEYNDTESY